jgi:4-hydroxy-2-oxoheptanedioate aldolase
MTYGVGGPPSGQNNALRTTLAERAVYGAWCNVPAPLNAEILSAAGFDFLIIDCQHGGVDYSDLLTMLQAMGRSATTPIVRVPGNDPFWIGKALDAGAQGIIVPMVNTRDDAERAVRACRHFPDGNRSWGPLRSRMFLGTNVPHINQEVMCLVMIETEEGIANADAICSVEGVDGVFIGPADLGLTLGVAPGSTDGMERVDAAIDVVLKACQSAGIIPGIARGAEFVERGFRLVTVTGDLELLWSAAKFLPPTLNT